MDLESAIRHAEEVAQENYGKATEYQYQCNELSKCLKCGDEHMQLAEWLKDYKRLKEQEPCEDAISRDAVEEIINDIRDCISVEGYWAILERLKKLPPVKPQEPTGHWIIIGDRYIKCSECGHITKTESPDIYKFCMVCGAKMSENPTGSESEG